MSYKTQSKAKLIEQNTESGDLRGTEIMRNAMTNNFNFRSLFKILIFSAFFAGCTTSTVLACTCINNKSFLEVIERADFIVVAKPTNYGEISLFSNIPLTVDVEIQRVLKGDNASQKVRVFGDNGAQCRPYVTKFPLDTTWVFALNLLSTGANGESQYYISNCGEYSLQVKAGRVFGRIKSSQPTSQALPRFIKSVRR